MTHTASSGRHFQKMIQKVKRESSDSSPCQKESSAPLSKQRDRTMAANPFYITGKVSSDHYPEVSSKDRNLQRVNTNSAEHFGNAISLSTTKNSATMVTESYNHDVIALATTVSHSSAKQSRKVNSKYTPAVNFTRGESYSPSSKRPRGSEEQQGSEGQFSQKIKEFKEKQALWHVSVGTYDPGFDVSTRFASPRNLSNVIPYDYETNRYPLLSDANYYYARETGDLDTIGQGSRADINVSSSAYLNSKQREDNELVAGYETCEPVIEKVVSLANTQQPKQTVTSLTKRRANRLKTTQDGGTNLIDKTDSGESGNSENDESLNAGKYISDLAQPYTNIPDDHQVAHINGLLSLPSNRETRYGITYGELKRRCNSPESLTRVDLVAYVRHSKSSGRSLLDKYRIVSSGNRTSRPTVLSKMCENEARVLGDGILKMNVDYFPGTILAQTAATRVKEQTRRICEGHKKDEIEERKNKIRDKIQEIEITRSMLKEIYDLLHSAKDMEEMKRFELASHTFGTANLMNHLTLFDRFFEDYQTSLSSKRKRT